MASLIRLSVGNILLVGLAVLAIGFACLTG